jgi:hypothetical protein
MGNPTPKIFCKWYERERHRFLKYENITNGTLSFIREKTKHSTKDNIHKIEVFITKDIDRIIINGEENLKEQLLLFLIFLGQMIYLISLALRYKSKILN